jgi:coenzyme Q-binding protein COQ10
MPKLSDTLILPYQPKQLYDMVLDIEKYPKFLPWCEASRIIEKNNEFILADLIIKYKAFSGAYRSKVVPTYTNNQYFIDVSLIEGPFTHLYNQWRFLKSDNGTLLEFQLDFNFKSVLLEGFIKLIFEQATKKMITAFQERAKEIYGT